MPALLLSTLLALSSNTSTLIEPPVPLSKVDVASGWKSYSGASAKSLWKGYKQSAFPAQGWILENNELKQAAPAGGDLITTDQFTDFELICDFKLDAKANSGIIWHASEKLDASWQSGPEYQLLEDASYASDKLNVGQSCGAAYELYPPAAGKVIHPAGQWNNARVYLRNGVLQHWLNGVKLVDARIAGDDGKPTKEWQDKIAASKFKEYQGFGLAPKGAIALQDHGGGVSFRDIKIRDLSAPLAGEIKLFNGKDMEGWEAILPGRDGKPAGKMEDAWSVKDGVIICKGNPIGYIRTKADYKNFIIKLEWRFNPVTKQAGNSGVLVRMVGADKVWPKSVEAQLESGSAGDFWNIEDVKMTTEKSRTNGRNTKHTHAAERPIGEWNEYEITVNRGDVILKVNGEELNRATGVEEVAGKICLQSEGAEIHFRNIRLVPLD
ncbi:MAG: DUF1080 domain-containing protein [Pyrinomonadaceae bacterium]|nr:DUF1080 domain-containing protein [Phycisphaerales bacterium]